jgi:hypothetical protein
MGFRAAMNLQKQIKTRETFSARRLIVANDDRMLVVIRELITGLSSPEHSLVRLRSGQIITASKTLFLCALSGGKKIGKSRTLKSLIPFIRVIHNVFFVFYLQYANVEACLTVLRQNSVPGVESVTTNDIIGGRLKAILSLFFSLSRYKQASKLKAPSNKLQQAHTSTLDMMHATR